MGVRALPLSWAFDEMLLARTDCPPIGAGERQRYCLQ